VKEGHDEALEFITKLHVELFSLSNIKKSISIGSFIY